VLNWQMSYEGKGVSVQIIFTPYKPYPGKTITFLQSLLRTKTSDADPTKRPRVDLLTFSWENGK